MGYNYYYNNNRYNYLNEEDLGINLDPSLFEKENKTDDDVFIFDENLSKDEIKKLKIKSKNLSKKLDFVMQDYYNFSKKLLFDLKEIKYEYHDEFDPIISDLDLMMDKLIDYENKCNNLNIVNDLVIKVEETSKYLKSIKKEYNNKLLKINNLEQETIESKIDEYNELILNVELILENKLSTYSQSNSKLSEMINETMQFSSYVDAEDLLNNLEKIKSEDKSNSKFFNYYKKRLEKMSLNNHNNVEQVNHEINNLNQLFIEINQINVEDFVKSVTEQEKVYQELLSINNKYASANVKKLLYETEKYFKRPMFVRQLKKFNLDDGELDMIRKDIGNDIVNQIIVDDGNLKEIIKKRCRDFRKNNFRIDEEEIDNILKDFTFSEIAQDVVDECKDKVKIDFLEGNITINQVELKLNNYINKKLRESDQLEELERIKNNPRVPAIKIHLTQEENDEIYIITKEEIISEYGIDGNVENRVYFWMNKKIRENQSEARGRLNSIKREFSTLTKLDNDQQNEFIHQIEFNINDNKIKYYEITEEYIVELSEYFINYGKLEL